MPFPLKDIEKHIDDGLIMAAEELIARNRVAPIKELEKHLWFTTVNDDKAYEVEVQITPSKVKAFSCDCKPYILNKTCKHIISALFLLRKEKLQQAAQKQQKKQANKKHIQKLSVPLLLKNIPETDLKSFVQEYAKSNPNFAISLKAKFAKVIEIDDNFEKYSTILKAAISNTKKSKGVIKGRNAKHLYQTIQELLNQIDEDIALEHYTDAFLLLRVLLKHLPLAIAQADQINILKAFIQQCIDILVEFCKKVTSPQLKKQLWEFCFEAFKRPFYHAHDFDTDLMSCLLSLAVDPKDDEQLLAFLTEESQHNDSPDRSARLLLFEIKILEKLNRKEETQKLIEANLHNRNILAVAIKNACAEKNYLHAEQLASSALQNVENNIEKRLLEKTLLKIALDQKNEALILQYARLCFFHDYEIQYFQLCKKFITDNWLDFRNQLLEEIDQKAYRIELKDAKAAIFYQENMFEELMAYIRKISSLHLLQKYDAALFVDHEPVVTELYMELLSNYLKNHLGRQAAIKIKSVLQHLKQQGKFELTNQLVTIFKNLYAERHALIEELERV